MIAWLRFLEAIASSSTDKEITLRDTTRKSTKNAQGLLTQCLLLNKELRVESMLPLETAKLKKFQEDSQSTFNSFAQESNPRITRINKIA